VSDKSCPCHMFQTQGICWHTGYVHTYRDQMKPEPVPTMPRAYVRRLQFMELVNEIEAKKQKRNNAV
jgi:hypothetical protein